MRGFMTQYEGNYDTGSFEALGSVRFVSGQYGRFGEAVDLSASAAEAAMVAFDR